MQEEIEQKSVTLMINGTKFSLRTLKSGTVKYYAQIHLQVWQNSVCTGQGNLPLIT